MKDFCVLQAVYRNDSPLFLSECFQSLKKQTYAPNAIILVKDGELTEELEAVIDFWKNELPLTVVGYSENKGLAYALNYGIDYINTEYVARMDSDDVCFDTRFEKQINFLEDNQNIQICGTGIREFYIEKNGSIIRRKRVYPKYTTNKAKSLYKGTPLAHPTLMIKTSLLKEYKYSECTRMNEDIDLWFRLLIDNHEIYNLEEELLDFRITDATFKRRSFYKAFNEYKIYSKYLNKLFGFSVLNVYPILRLFSRFLPYRLSKYLYLSDFRTKLFSKR